MNRTAATVAIEVAIFVGLIFAFNLVLPTLASAFAPDAGWAGFVFAFVVGTTGRFFAGLLKDQLVSITTVEVMLPILSLVRITLIFLLFAFIRSAVGIRVSRG